MPYQPAEHVEFIHVGSTLPLPSALQLTGNTSVNWKRFRAAWDNYEIASRLKTKDKVFRTATLLTCIGQEALDIFNGLAFEDESHKEDILISSLRNWRNSALATKMRFTNSTCLRLP